MQHVDHAQRERSWIPKPDFKLLNVLEIWQFVPMAWVIGSFSLQIQKWLKNRIEMDGP